MATYEQVRDAPEAATPVKPSKPAEPTRDRWGAMFCCCFDDAPHPDDPYAEGVRAFRVPMCDACCEEPCCCITSFFCLPCAQCYLRKEVIGHDMNRYACCQHYYDSLWQCCCCKNGCGEESCPHFCLCMESFFCPGLAVSASRMTVMDQELLYSDPCDRRLIVFNNCIQCLACACDIAAAISRDDNVREAARAIDVAAHVVFLSTAACMTAQVYHELKFIESQAEKGAIAEGYGGPDKQNMA